MICWNNKRDSLICGIYLKKKKEEISKKHRVGRNQVAPKESVEEIFQSNADFGKVPMQGISGDSAKVELEEETKYDENNVGIHSIFQDIYNETLVEDELENLIIILESQGLFNDSSFKMEIFKIMDLETFDKLIYLYGYESRIMKRIQKYFFSPQMTQV